MRGFESLLLRHIYWPLGQAVKTPPFHGGITGSNPVGVINKRKKERSNWIVLFFFYSRFLLIIIYIAVGHLYGISPKGIRLLHHLAFLRIFLFLFRLINDSYFPLISVTVNVSYSSVNPSLRRHHIIYCNYHSHLQNPKGFPMFQTVRHLGSCLVILN